MSEDVRQRDEYYEKLAEKNDFSKPRAIEHMGGVAVYATALNPREHATQG